MRILRILGSMVLVLFWWTSGAEAACSGAGQSWNCTAGTTSAEISSTLSSASDGATLTFAPGSYSWNSWASFSNSKGATLICASVGACDVSVSGTVLGMNGNCSGTNTKLYRISGFDFIGGSNSIIWFHAYNTGACTLSNVRIDHNTFTGQSAGNVMIFFGDSDTPAFFYGVIDHNTATNATSIALAQMVGGGNTSTAPAGTRGTANNMFFENNTLTITTMTNAGLGCMDSWGGQSWVWRYNTTTNCLLTSHGVTHSWGPVNIEIYGSRFIVNGGAEPDWQDCERCFHHQGSGETIVFDNQFTAFSGKDPGAIAMTHYRSAVSGSGSARCDGTVAVDGNRPGQLGYPCKRQPGRDVNGKLQPMYTWNNRWSDTGGILVMEIENPWGAINPSVPDHIAANRDYYNAVSASAQSSATSPFNGTTGMGFGTLANRPTTCTPTPQAADAGNGGVGYFATNQGPQGTLYRCSASNTWTVHYTPYPYPHPLQAGNPGTSPAPPTNVRIIS